MGELYDCLFFIISNVLYNGRLIIVIRFCGSSED